LNIYGLPAIQMSFSFFLVSFVLLANGKLKLINGTWSSPYYHLCSLILYSSSSSDTISLHGFWLILYYLSILTYILPLHVHGKAEENTKPCIRLAHTTQHYMGNPCL